MTLKQLTSAIYNDIVGGLRGYSGNLSISLEQLEDDIIDERLIILKEFSAKNMMPIKDLLLSINCIELDTMSLDKCPCSKETGKPRYHFELPQILNDYGESAVHYIGPTDKINEFRVYTSMAFKHHFCLRRGSKLPFVYIDTTPNENNMYDAWIFNINNIEGEEPLTTISVMAIFKDPRQLEQFACCGDLDDIVNFNFIDNEIKRRLTEKKIRYYRQMMGPMQPNDQQPK